MGWSRNFPNDCHVIGEEDFFDVDLLGEQGRERTQRRLVPSCHRDAGEGLPHPDPVILAQRQRSSCCGSYLVHRRHQIGIGTEDLRIGPRLLMHRRCRRR